MSNTYTLFSQFNEKTNRDFKPERAQDSLKSAYIFVQAKKGGTISFSAGSDFSDYVVADWQVNTVIVMLAALDAYEKRKYSKRDENLEIKTIEELWTEQMDEMLKVDEGYEDRRSTYSSSLPVGRITDSTSKRWRG
jgi:protein tyrosine phosphatase